MIKERPLFTIKIEAPLLKKGHISIPLLLTICENAQKAVASQTKGAEGPQSGGNLESGPILELVGLRKGSTVLDFAEARSAQLPMEYMQELPPASVEALEDIAAALSAANRNRREWADAVVPDALNALDDMGAVFDHGVAYFKWIIQLRQGTKRTTVKFTPTTLERIKQRKSELVAARRFKQTSVKPAPAETETLFEGILESADGKCRIEPVMGAALTFAFDAQQAPKVFGALHRAVRAKVDQHSHKLVEISVAEEDNMDKRLFFEAKSIDDLVAEQGIAPMVDMEALSGAIPDEDIDDFLAEIYIERRGSIG